VSWHFLQGPAEVSSADISWDGNAFAPSKSRTTLGAYCLPGNVTDACPAFPFGMMLRRLTGIPGAAGLTWYQGDSPVRTYLPPERAPESEATVPDCGPSSPESLAKFNPPMYSWKTAQCSLFGGLTPFLGTWPRWGTMLNGECYPRRTAVRRTSGRGSGFWPTPLVPNGGCSPAEPMTRTGMTPDGHKRQVDLQFAVRHWDTPTQADAPPRALNRKGPYYGKGQKYLQAQVYERFPTPSRIDADFCHMKTETAPGRFGKKQVTLAVAIQVPDGGKLNPTWVEWLMGWPLWWTDLAPLATDKFLSWRQAHSEFCGSA